MDTVSLTSSSSALSMSRGPQEYVELNIHGIEQVGKIFLTSSALSMSRGPQEYVELNIHGIEQVGKIFLTDL